MGENMKIGIQIGKTYKIEDLLELLYSDMRIGHIVVAGVHKYHQDKSSVEDILLTATKGLGKGDKIPTIYATVLKIADPFEKYRIFEPFYSSIEGDIISSIDQSAHKEIAISVEDMMGEAKKFGLTGIEKTGSLMDLLPGLKIYFNRKGINVGTISAEKYLTFKKV